MKAGQRVRFRVDTWKAIGREEMPLEGLTGTVVLAGTRAVCTGEVLVAIRLDAIVPALDEWDNELQWTQDDFALALEDEADLVARVAAMVDPIDASACTCGSDPLNPDTHTYDCPAHVHCMEKRRERDTEDGSELWEECACGAERVNGGAWEVR